MKVEVFGFMMSEGEYRFEFPDRCVWRAVVLISLWAGSAQCPTQFKKFSFFFFKFPIFSKSFRFFKKFPIFQKVFVFFKKFPIF